MTRLNAAQRKDLFVFTLALSETQGAGVPILFGLEAAAAGIADPGFRSAVLKIRDSIKEGAEIAKPMREQAPEWFDNMYVQMVAAGQETGKLDEMLGKIAGYLEQDTPMDPLALCFIQLGSMAQAGLPLAQAISIVGENSPDPGLRKTLLQVAAAIKGGANLPEALAAHPAVFSPFVQAMAKAGDTGGNLDVVLDRIGSTLGRMTSFVPKGA